MRRSFNIAFRQNTAQIVGGANRNTGLSPARSGHPPCPGQFVLCTDLDFSQWTGAGSNRRHQDFQRSLAEPKDSAFPL